MNRYLNGIEVEAAHRAEDDAKAAIKLLSKENEYGITYLKELLSKSPEIKKYTRVRRSKSTEKHTYEIKLNIQASESEQSIPSYTQEKQKRTFKEKLSSLFKNKYFWLVVLIIYGTQNKDNETNGFLAAVVTWALIVLGIKLYRKMKGKNHKMV